VPVDETTWRQALTALSLAHKQGQSPIEVLDQHRLLLTPARELEVRLNELGSLYRLLEAQSAAKLLQFYFGRPFGTPEDMYRAVMMWLEAVASSKEEG
jgi:hypothetical protein